VRRTIAIAWSVTSARPFRAWKSQRGELLTQAVEGVKLLNSALFALWFQLFTGEKIGFFQ
jgi:hypothetical protein